MNLIPYLPTLCILALIPHICFSDIRTRTVKTWVWIPVIISGIISLGLYLQESPERNLYLLGLSIALCIGIFAVAIIGGIGGADAIFASCIMLFIQYNPFHFPRVFFPLDFLWTLLMITITLPIWIYGYNLYLGNLKGDELTSTKPYTFIEMLTKFPRGVPFMIPISLAFIITLLMEVLL